MRFSKKVQTLENGVNRISTRLDEPAILKKVEIVQASESELHVAVRKEHGEIFKTIEAQIIDKAQRSKELWFGKETIADRVIEAAVKRCVQSGILCVTVTKDSVAFDSENNVSESMPTTGMCHLAVDITSIDILKSEIVPRIALVQIRSIAPSKRKVKKESLFELDDAEDDEFEE